MSTTNACIRTLLLTTAFVLAPRIALAQTAADAGSQASTSLGACKVAGASAICVYDPIAKNWKSVAPSQVGAVNKAGDTMGPLQITGGAPSTAGSYTGDGTATWVPADAALGVFLAPPGAPYSIYATRGTTSSNGVYPPGAGYGSPISNGMTGALINARGDGAKTTQSSGAVVNMDIVGGPVSQAHPSDAASPNAVALSIFTHQRPDSFGNMPPAGWSVNWDHMISPGSGVFQAYGVEGDLNNFSGDCHVGGGCTSAWYFYGGVNPYPNLAFHYFGNPHTTPYAGTVTTSGNVFTLVSGSFSPLTTFLNYAGTKFRVTCTTSTCTADVPIGTNSVPGAFTAFSAAAHNGLFFQDAAAGANVQDNDFLMADSAHTVLKTIGYHAVGLDFTGDAMPNAALLKAGQNVCFSGAANCLSFSTGLNAWLFSPTSSQGAYVAKIDAAGNGAFASVLSAGNPVVTQNVASTLYTSAVTAASGALTSANGTVQYEVLNKRVYLNVIANVVTNGTGATTVFLNLPITVSARDCIINGREANLNGKTLNGLIPASSSQLQIYNYDNSYPGADGAKFELNGSCALP